MARLPALEGLPEPRTANLRPPSNAQRTRRAAETLRAVRRRLGPVLVRRALRQRVAPADVARGLREAVSDLGATWVKFGQLVASAPGLFGEEVSDQFRVLLDRGPRVPFDQVRRVVERETGWPLSQSFASFDTTPIGQASMAVVHRATLPDGRAVAVKVLRPGIRGKVATDLFMMRRVLPPVIERVSGSRPELFDTLMDGLTQQLSEELDLRNEAGVMTLFRELIEVVGLSGVVIPEVIESLSGRRVLTMEFLDGVPIDDLAQVERLGYDPRPVVAEVVRSFFLTVLGYGVFHGDVHAGNLLLMRDGRVGVLDWGIIGRMRPENRRSFRTAIRAALGDESAWDTVTGDFVEQWGEVVRSRTGMDDAAIAAMVRTSLEQLFTLPFGQVSLAALVLGPDAAEAGLPVAGLPKIDRSAAGGAPGIDPAVFDRGMLLLGKQLLYFERYGRMYLSDTPLLADREFFEHLLESTPD